MTEKINRTAPLPIWQAVLLTALSALTAAFAAFIASGLFMCISGVLFAFLLCRNSAAAWLAVPVSYALEFMFSGSPHFALTALLFLIIGIPLAACIKRRCSLSVVTAVLSAAAAAVLAALFAATLWQIYGSAIGGFKSYISDTKAIFGEVLGAVRTLTDENGFIIFTDQVISQLKQMFLMTLPATLIICCEGLAYITAKLFLLLCIIFKDTELIVRPWRVHTAAMTSAVFAVSYLVCMLASDADVVFYSAMNLMVILMPLTSISGFHSMFGEKSAFRTSPRAGTRILLISTCVILFFINPLLLLMTLSFWGAFDSLRTFIRNRKR